MEGPGLEASKEDANGTAESPALHVGRVERSVLEDRLIDFHCMSAVTSLVPFEESGYRGEFVVKLC